MTPVEVPNVIIDGAIPRTDIERAACVIDAANQYVNETQASIRYTSRLRQLTRQLVNGDEDHEIENEAVSIINQVLPDDYVCTVGEVNPGDVIVREIDPQEEGVFDS